MLVQNGADHDGMALNFEIQGIGELFYQCSPEWAEANRKHFWAVSNQIDNIVDALEESQPESLAFGFVISSGVQYVAFSL